MTTFFNVLRDGKTVECEITAEAHGPEHDVGIMGPWFEGIAATSLETKQPIELTEEEEAEISAHLTDGYYDDVD